KRGKAFTKIIREITVAARELGGDPTENPRLRTVIDKARAVNMPQDNIQKAIKRGTGQLEGITYEEHHYEGYGPGGAAVTLSVLTDNKNRTISDVRNIFGKNGGNLGEAGCVTWIFEKKGVLQFDKSYQEDSLMEAVLDAGAEDLTDEEEYWAIMTAPENFEAVKKTLETKGMKAQHAEVTMVPKTSVKLSGADAERMLKLMEALEDHDDVQNVYSNFDISKEEMEKLAS
ncbi:MAG: YebC/PmpR family DNA-binding transcriptional regulator, partial [bacterium]|nr:YebC/PmpR family DNA-binding transcriptional regulator [bacterium]